MRQRLPLILSITALVVAVAATYLLPRLGGLW